MINESKSNANGNDPVQARRSTSRRCTALTGGARCPKLPAYSGRCVNGKNRRRYRWRTGDLDIATLRQSPWRIPASTAHSSSRAKPCSGVYLQTAVIVAVALRVQLAVGIFRRPRQPVTTTCAVDQRLARHPRR